MKMSPHVMRGTCQARLRTNELEIVEGNVRPEILFRDEHDHEADDEMVDRAEIREAMTY
jgi:hypothetical protein